MEVASAVERVYVKKKLVMTSQGHTKAMQSDMTTSPTIGTLHQIYRSILKVW